jgi:hypothetical protein
MSNQETDKAAAESKDKNAEIDDLPVAESDTDSVKGGIIPILVGSDGPGHR